ncbi:hypothetical protein B296_00026536 [Ensete ventricosum]|uniref:Uncharacterized protein n=1 Tax=Ensete ventricosum TaxID=4639 RepID=A0A427ARB9_ENSVE|nr:hypothetical protein B296_00026536 [Ensete ventricosum]
MAESYDGAVGAVVWREDMVRHVVLMARREGVEWRSMQTPLPRMLTTNNELLTGFGSTSLFFGSRLPSIKHSMTHMGLYDMLKKHYLCV